MSLGAIDWDTKVFCEELTVFLGHSCPRVCWGLCTVFAMYGCLLCVLPSSCPCAHLLICLCLCELVLFAASPISNLPKFSTLRHGIFVQNGPSPFSSSISFLKLGHPGETWTSQVVVLLLLLSRFSRVQFYATP